MLDEDIMRKSEGQAEGAAVPANNVPANADPGIGGVISETSMSSTPRDRTKFLLQYWLEGRAQWDGETSLAFCIDGVQCRKKNNMFIAFFKEQQSMWAPPQDRFEVYSQPLSVDCSSLCLTSILGEWGRARPRLAKT